MWRNLEAYFETFLQEGKDILHLCLSSGITGVLNSANIARDILLEKYPERKIYIVDSFGSFLRLRTFDGSACGFARCRHGGLADLYHWAEENKRKVQHWFFLQI